MSEHTEALPHEDFSDLVEWKAAQRRKDAADIVAGLRTPEEIGQENTRWFIPRPKEVVFLNEYEAYESL